MKAGHQRLNVGGVRLEAQRQLGCRSGLGEKPRLGKALGCRPVRLERLLKLTGLGKGIAQPEARLIVLGVRFADLSPHLRRLGESSLLEELKSLFFQQPCIHVAPRGAQIPLKAAEDLFQPWDFRKGAAPVYEGLVC